LKSGSLTLLEPSGPVQACNGIVLPVPFIYLDQNLGHLETTNLYKNTDIKKIYFMVRLMSKSVVKNPYDMIYLTATG